MQVLSPHSTQLLLRSLIQASRVSARAESTPAVLPPFYSGPPVAPQVASERCTCRSC